jgi:TPR repeat protein
MHSAEVRIQMRRLSFIVAGLVCVAALGWLTSYAFAVFAYGALLAATTSDGAVSRPAYAPPWMSTGGGRAFLALVQILGFMLPLLIGVVWFRWWWGFVGLALSVLSVPLIQPKIPGDRVFWDLMLGLVLSVTAAGAMCFGGEGAPRGKRETAALYRKACDGGDPKSCHNLGLMYNDGQGVPADRVKAAYLFRHACDGGVVDSCYNLGVMRSTGEGVPQDHAMAAALFRTACDAGYAKGCHNLGVVYQNGQGVPQEMAQAARLFQKACDGRVAQGCFNLGLMHYEGDDVSQDMAQAARLFQSACDGGYPKGCLSLGVMFSKGEGLQLSGAAAAEMYHKAGLLYLKEGDRSNALLCVERIRTLAKAMDIPNASLADRLLATVRGSIHASSGRAGSSLP